MTQNRLCSTFMELKNNQKFKLIFEGIVFIFYFVFMVIDLYNANTSRPLHFLHWPVGLTCFIFATFLVFYLEFDYFKLYKQIYKLQFNMDLLIAFATHLTYLFSVVIGIIKIINQQYDDIGMEFYEVGYSLSFFIGIGHLIEDNLKIKSSLGIKDLLKLQNRTALIKNKNKQFIETKSQLIKPGDVIKVIKGTSIQTDGIMLSKQASLDYASLLGESIPRNVKKGEKILSGCIALDDNIIYIATETVANSALSRIIKQLENIINNKTRIERISECIVKFFLPSVVILSLITFILWMCLNFNHITINVDLPWETAFSDNELGYIQSAIFHAISVLVVACPCAFGIATPAAIYSSSFIASKNKILFANAQTYELLNKIKFLAFDKTGTLTKNEPKVIEHLGDKKYNALIFEIVKCSLHPLSIAIKQYLQFTKSNLKIDHIKEIPGIGLKLKYKNRDYFLGSLNYVLQQKYQWKVNKITETNHNSIVVFCENKKIVAYFKIKDQIKSDAKSVIDKFKKMNIKTIILSGDLQANVDDVAKQLGIDYAYGNLLPDAKTNKINEFKQQGKIVFVGDGINDILAVKAADVGISYASGSEITNSVADISLLENDLNLVLKTFYLSKRTILLIRLNFVWATIFNLICVPLSMIGFIPLWLGVILMTTSTIFLLVNTLTFKYFNNKKISQSIM